MISATLKCGTYNEANGDMTVAVYEDGKAFITVNTGRDGGVYLDAAACEVLRALMTAAIQTSKDYPNGNLRGR